MKQKITFHFSLFTFKEKKMKANEKFKKIAEAELDGLMRWVVRKDGLVYTLRNEEKNKVYVTREADQNGNGVAVLTPAAALKEINS
jgi:hypothetical protein